MINRSTENQKKRLQQYYSTSTEIFKINNAVPGSDCIVYCKDFLRYGVNNIFFEIDRKLKKWDVVGIDISYCDKDTIAAIKEYIELMYAPDRFKCLKKNWV